MCTRTLCGCLMNETNCVLAHSSAPITTPAQLSSFPVAQWTDVDGGRTWTDRGRTDGEQTWTDLGRAWTDVGVERTWTDVDGRDGHGRTDVDVDGRRTLTAAG